MAKASDFTKAENREGKSDVIMGSFLVYSAATVTWTPCVLAQRCTSYCSVQVTIHNILHRLYVGIKIVYAQIDVQVTVMYELESVQVTVVGLYAIIF